jgi:hypothetical protein
MKTFFIFCLSSPEFTIQNSCYQHWFVDNECHAVLTLYEFKRIHSKYEPLSFVKNLITIEPRIFIVFSDF